MPAVITSAVFLGIASLFIIYGREKIDALIVSHFKYLFYGSALAFGLLHATNFTGNPWIILAFSPLLGGPQIVVGLFLGTIRMKNGLAYSMLFHMAVNMIALIL
ncbi:MAG TPA: CPBP family intramembrane metalloprotease [Bacteroidetes bacterium]|nr:CPBP family intramembrane metalloprotease [Bacteroidota bacterium]